RERGNSQTIAASPASGDPAASRAPLMAACNRRGRKAEAHRRWESVSSTIDVPCGVVLNDVPDAAVNSVVPSFQNKPR
ncbi:unnamed protein product, partial [Ectocarpus sp. 4 AP-2014]